MSLLSEIEFGSFLAYSPKGIEKVSINSRVVRDAIKGDRSLTLRGTLQRAIPFFSAELKSRLPGSPLEDWFVRRPVLVPAPRSALMVPNSLYPTRLICENMVANGLGAETHLLLERTEAVPKASFSKPEDRPTIQKHYDTLRVKAELAGPDEIVVVDDFVTQGTMLIAAVSRLKEAYPQAKVRAFALVRTMSGQEIDHIAAMCHGTIRQRGGWGVRRP